MTNLNKICMSALLLGAAAIATPAFAQVATPSDSAQASTTTQVAATDQASTHDMDIKAAANAHVDSVGDTSKKYVRSHRAADFAKEQSITAQLNQQAGAAAAPGPSVR